MLRGVKPANLALKLVKGDKRLNLDEPQPSGEVKKPSFVKGQAAKLWNQYTPELTEHGILTAWDVDMFGAWCCLMAEFHRAPEQFTASKLTQMRTLGEAFGLLPPGRARLKSSGKKQSKDPAEKYF